MISLPTLLAFLTGSIIGLVMADKALPRLINFAAFLIVIGTILTSIALIFMKTWELFTP